MGLLGGSAAFFYVALYAAADNIFPAALAALTFGEHVIERELSGGKFSTAILAFAAVARVDVSAIEFHVLARKLVIAQQANDSWHGDLKAHRVNPVVAVWFELGLERRELLPLGEIQVLPLAFAGGVGLDVNDLGEFAAKQRESPAHIDDADGLVISIENKNIGGKRRNGAAVC